MAGERLTDATAQLIERVDSWLSGLQGLAQAHGTEAWDASIRAMQYSGAARLIAVIPLLIVSVVTWRIATRAWKRLRADGDDADGFVMCTTGAAAIISTVVLCGLFFDLDNWVRIFDPLAVMAGKIIGVN